PLISEIVRTVVLLLVVSVNGFGRALRVSVSTLPGGVKSSDCPSFQVDSTPRGNSNLLRVLPLEVSVNTKESPCRVSRVTTPRAAAAVAPCHTDCWRDVTAAISDRKSTLQSRENLVCRLLLEK